MKTPRNIKLRKRSKKSSKISDFIAFFLIPILTLSIALLLSSSTYAETSGKTNVSVEVKQGCNVTAKNNEHISSISNGTYSTIGDSTEFTISCNGNNKYDIYAIGFTGDTEGNNKLVGDKDSDNKYNIVTGIAQSGEVSNWAFKLSDSSEGLILESNYSDDFTSIPGSSIKVAGRPASTVNNTTDTFKSTYAAYISKPQPADTYHGKVRYTLVDQGTTPITNYSITYDINGGDTSSLPSPNPQTGQTMDSTITLSDTTPTRDGYEFVAWCSTNPEESDTCPEGGKSYEVGGSYPLDDGISATLYATWRQSALPMQDWQGCDALGSEETIQLQDLRDNTIYSVAKLKDGKCWMTQNLRLGDDKLINRTLTPDTSDVSSNYDLPVSNISDLNYGDCNSSVSDKKALYIDTNNGGYYNINVMLASDSSNQYSICPKGWRPPTKTEFTDMAAQYGNDTLVLQSSLVNLRLSGFVNDKILQASNTQGYYWTYTNAGCGGQYLFSISNDNLGFETNEDWHYNYLENVDGATLRCVMRQANENYNDNDTDYSVCPSCW